MISENQHNIEYQSLFTVNAALKDQYKQLEVDYQSLKSLMESCSKPLDKLSKKLLPIKSEVQILGHSVKGLNTMIFDVTKNLTRNLLKGLNMSTTGRDSQQNQSNLLQSFSSAFKSLISGERASGGNVAAGASYLVGERGPEIFKPAASGRIEKISPHSSPAINLVMNINTNDARSFQKSQSQIMAEAALMLRKASRNL